MSNELTIALTGASGHLGYVIHRRLQALGMRHRVFLRKRVDYISHDDIVVGQLDDPETLRKLVGGCTTVIHCAAKVWPRMGRNRHVQEVNTGLTRNLYAAAADAGVRHFIYISSIHSMNALPGANHVDEDTPLATNPRLSYDYSKAESERFLTGDDRMRVAIFNPTAIIGPGDHYFHGFNQFFQKLARRSMPLNVAGGFDVVDVRDVAAAVIRAAEIGAGGKFVVSGGFHTMRSLAGRYGELNDVKVPGGYLPGFAMRIIAWLVALPERIFSTVFSMNTYSVRTLLEGNHRISARKAREQLDFHARDVDRTLRDVHAWIHHPQNEPDYE